jgi:hypothetical protein
VVETLDAEELGNACNVVGQLSDAIGKGIAAEFGGKLLFDEADDPAVPEAKPPTAQNAGYL